MLQEATRYPDQLVRRLVASPRDGRDPEVVCSLVAGPDRSNVEHTLSSFLNCCTHSERIERFLVPDAGLSDQDRAVLLERYGFLGFREFCHLNPDNGPSTELTQIRAQIHERFWLHLGQGWRFFAPENLITLLTAVLEAEPPVSQVVINLSDATKLTRTSAPEEAVRRALDTGRYLLTNTIADGPAMFDTTRLDRSDGPHTASLDEVLCINSSEPAKPDI